MCIMVLHNIRLDRKLWTFKNVNVEQMKENKLVFCPWQYQQQSFMIISWVQTGCSHSQNIVHHHCNSSLLITENIQRHKHWISRLCMITHSHTYLNLLVCCFYWGLVKHSWLAFFRCYCWLWCGQLWGAVSDLGYIVYFHWGVRRYGEKRFQMWV